MARKLKVDLGGLGTVEGSPKDVTAFSERMLKGRRGAGEALKEFWEAPYGREETIIQKEKRDGVKEGTEPEVGLPWTRRMWRKLFPPRTEEEQPGPDEGFEGDKRYTGRIANTPRPRETIGSVTPLIETLPYRLPPYQLAMRDMYHGALLEPTYRTCVVTLEMETTRNGGKWEPLWTARCDKCGKEWEHRSPHRGCTDCIDDDGQPHPLEEPDRDDYKNAERFFNNINLNGQTLDMVMRECISDGCITDQSYLVIRKKYSADKEGNILRSDVRECIRGSPILIKPTGNTKGIRGGSFYTCVIHRDQVVEKTTGHTERYYGIYDNFMHTRSSNQNEVRWRLASDKGKSIRQDGNCPICGRKLYDVEWMSLSMEMGVPDQYFIHGEIIDWKTFSEGLTYSASPPSVTLWNDILFLLYQKKYLKEYYEYRRAPYALITMATASPTQFLETWEEIMTKLRYDPHYIPFIPLETDMFGNASGKPEVVRFTDTLQDNQFVQTREEARRRISGFFGVSNLWVNEVNPGKKSAGSEGFDFVVTNRRVDSIQGKLNGYVIPALLRALKVKNWRYVYQPAEARDEVRELQIQNMKADLALKNQTLGLKIGLSPHDDMEYTVSEDMSGGMYPLLEQLAQGADGQQHPHLSSIGGVTAMNYQRRQGEVQGQPDTVGAQAIGRDVTKGINSLIKKAGANCPACGLDIHFNASLGALQCPSCGFTYQYDSVGEVVPLEDMVEKAPPGPAPTEARAVKIPGAKLPAGMQSGQYRCDVCGQSFSTQQEKGGHMKSAHGDGGGEQSGQEGDGGGAPSFPPEVLNIIEALLTILVGRGGNMTEGAGKDGDNTKDTGRDGEGKGED